MGIDLGQVNLVTAVTNLKGHRPLIIDGGDLKYINGCYNKLLSMEYSKLDKYNNKNKNLTSKISHKINRLWYRREHKIRNLMQ